MSESFRELAEVLNCQTDYENLISGMNIPKNRKTLNMVTAEWYVKTGKNLNRHNQKSKKIEEICITYADMYKRIKDKGVGRS